MGKLGGKLGAGVSNTDVSFIQTMGPQLTNTPQGNKLIIDFTDRMMDRQIQISKMARDYAKRNGGRLDMGFDEELSRFAEQNPLFTQQDIAAAQAAAQAAPTPKTWFQQIFGGAEKKKTIQHPRGPITIEME
jgi:hypothetical protein